ncbi:ArsR family transcriptional regulator [Patescibacteria group bacterium]|nr:MAG: ArsR family transcriptional regulator [Patescibacteria group bacterium]
MPSHEFKLEQLFGSKTRARLLGLFLMNPETSYFVRELTRKIDAQLNSVRRELKNLVELGLVVEKVGAIPKPGASLAEKKKYYIVNADFLLFEDLRGMFKKMQVLLKKILVKELEKKGSIEYFALTGRFVDRSDVPTDIVIVGGIDPSELQRVVGQFEADLGHEVNYTLLPKEEFLYRRQIADRFLMSILGGEKIVMVNTLGV